MFRRTLALGRLLNRINGHGIRSAPLLTSRNPLRNSHVRLLGLSNVQANAVAEAKPELKAVNISSKKPRAKRDEKRIKKGEREWEKYLLETLQKELKEENKRYATLQKRHEEHGFLIRNSVEKDFQSMVALLMRHAQQNYNARAINSHDDEFLSVGLLLLARHFQKLTTTHATDSSPALFFSTANLMARLRKTGTDSGTASVNLLIQLEKWAESRPEDENSEEISRSLEEMERAMAKRLGSLSVSDSRILLTESELSLVKSRLRKITGIADRKGNKSIDEGYDQNLRLVDHLREPVPPEQYHDNPYCLPYLGQEEYLSRFSTHLDMERATWLRVKNVCQKNSDIFAEKLLDGWQWREAIRKELGAKLGKLPGSTARGYIEVVGLDAAANVIYESVVRTLSQGQNLVPVPGFQGDLYNPLLQLVHRKFVSELGVDDKELWSRVFSDYSMYVCDSEVSRTHSHRAWWVKCCKRHGLAPDHYMPFREFPSEARRQLGIFLMGIVTDACVFPAKGTRKGQRDGPQPAFSLRNVAIEEESQLSEEGRANIVKMVNLHPQLIQLLEQHPFEYILFPTHQLPMTVPPRPWLDGGVGGPEYTRQVDVIRKIPDFKRININREMRERLKEGQARPVWDALNQLGCTPWTINEPMLKVLSKVFDMSGNSDNTELLDSLSVPLNSETVNIPNFVETFGNVKPEEVDQIKWREYGKNKAAAIKQKNEYNSLWCWMLYRIVLAHHFRGETLFFPHNMDFRGRVYPISPHLSHMGDDINRCMLKFAKGRPLGADGLRWLKLHVINLTGKLKRHSVDERLQAAEQLMPKILDSAERPLDGDRWWIDSDDPWQTLAACMELRDALGFKGDPKDFVSHLAVHQDGSCNGLQHYAALGRDRQGGEEVNLLPSPVPNDVYSSVAVRVEQKRIEDENSKDEAVRELVLALRKALPQVVPRKVIKQTVMTTVYGVTMYGGVLQIKKQLKALDIEGDDLGRFSSYLAIKTFASLNDSFTSSMQLKDWFRDCAKTVGDLMRTTEWVTPLGLPVVQPYLRVKEKQRKLILAPVTMKQVDAFPPNLVHSLDSTHMMLTSLECARRGVTFAAVHDCFWTHASTVEEMNVVCRDMFVKLHSQPLVQQCGEDLRARYLPHEVVSRMTPDEKEHYVKQFTPQVQPGSLDIEQVKQSVYFFS